jgi:hypothetical protein
VLHPFTIRYDRCDISTLHTPSVSRLVRHSVSSRSRTSDRAEMGDSC